MLPDWVLEEFDKFMVLFLSRIKENPYVFILGVAFGLRISKVEFSEMIDATPLFLLAESILPYIG